MIMILQRLDETPEELIPGEIVGQISLETDGELKFDISDEALEERLQELFSKPLTARVGDPSGKLSITVSKSVEPKTPEFFEQVLDLLEGPDYRLTGHIER